MDIGDGGEVKIMAKFLVWKVDDEKGNKREGGGRGGWGHEGFIFGFVRSFYWSSKWKYIGVRKIYWSEAQWVF